MSGELSLFKKAVLTWTYNQLNSKFPDYFNSKPYINLDAQTVKNSPNVYWADTVRDRPLDATECYLDIISDTSDSFGTDGVFYQDPTDNKYYYKLTEPHNVTVNFAISSMKNKQLGLSALQAQNLSHDAITYLRMQLKSGSASDYFRYENDIFSPILVCSQKRNMSEISNISIFEDTRNRHTNQFSCLFTFDQIDKREVDLAQNIFNTVEYAQDTKIDFYTKEETE